MITLKDKEPQLIQKDPTGYTIPMTKSDYHPKTITNNWQRFAI